MPDVFIQRFASIPTIGYGMETTLMTDEMIYMTLLIFLIQLYNQPSLSALTSLPM